MIDWTSVAVVAQAVSVTLAAISLILAVLKHRSERRALAEKERAARRSQAVEALSDAVLAVFAATVAGPFSLNKGANASQGMGHVARAYRFIEPEDRDVVLWVIDQTTQIAALSSRMEYSAFIQPWHKRNVNKVSEILGETLGAISAWQLLERPTSWFTEQRAHS